MSLIVGQMQEAGMLTLTLFDAQAARAQFENRIASLETACSCTHRRSVHICIPCHHLEEDRN